MLTLFISIYFQPQLIQNKRKMYCLSAKLAFISCSDQVQGPLSRLADLKKRLINLFPAGEYGNFHI